MSLRYSVIITHLIRKPVRPVNHLSPLLARHRVKMPLSKNDSSGRVLQRSESSSSARRGSSHEIFNVAKEMHLPVDQLRFRAADHLKFDFTSFDAGVSSPG